MHTLLLLMASIVLMASHAAWAREGVITAGMAPAQSHDDEWVRIGKIEIDRRAGRFRVPGSVTRLEPPLEYLAVARGGAKAYETLLEVDASGIEFNTACILIGLEQPDADAKPRFQFDEGLIDGHEVELHVSWEDASGPRDAPAERLLAIADVEVEKAQWVYIGSLFLDGDRYGAQESGTLIGFVHDPLSVIEHREGLGIGRYGSVAGNTHLAPPKETPIWLTVTNPAKATGEGPVSSE